MARDDLERLNLGQEVEDFLGDAVREILLLRIATHVLERQYGDRPLGWRTNPPLVVGEQQQPGQQDRANGYYGRLEFT